MEILGAILGPVVEYIISPLVRELGYLFSYKKNIEELKTELKNLKDVQEKVQSWVNEGKGNSLQIYGQVSTWLDSADKELAQQSNEGGSNINDIESNNLSCFNKLVKCEPRKIKKKVEHVLKLIVEGKNFDKNNVGSPGPLLQTKCPDIPGGYQSLETRMSMAKQIKNALADPTVNLVGIIGMGGVGKTMLLKEVKKLALESNLFTTVIIVTVGKSKNVRQVQDIIIERLNTKVEANDDEARAFSIQNKISESKEDTLIMLDDLWEKYDIKDFGIPNLPVSREKRCKVVMTSRSRDLLTNQFNIDKLFEMNSLSKEESWTFFTRIVGDFDNVDIKHIADKVVQECGGLPLALALVAELLKGKNIHWWKDTLKTLKNHSWASDFKMEEKLKMCVQRSYDSLQNEEAKSLLLLCSLFPDDYIIPMNDLQMYVMGMGILNDINNWEDGKNRVMTLVDKLTSSYLLIDSSREDFNSVQMHDVIHDVAREWNKEKRCGSFNVLNANSHDLIEPLQNSEFPNLQLLIINDRWCVTKDTFFTRMENLRVLDMRFMSRPPSNISSLKNLQTLTMTRCKCYDIHPIGELKKLKILQIRNCDGIEELPTNMSQLTELMVLNVSFCRELVMIIHPNIISSMKKLEELSFVESFDGWGEEVQYKGKKLRMPNFRN